MPREAGWIPTITAVDTETSIYGEISGVAIMVDCYTPGKFDRADLLTLVNNQAARLSSYRTAD